ncbi:MAG: aminotransferase class I/II-fold pyridoxal phosphate-dependent enzyme [Anaerolineae bacterium]|nr:aminotransferase class I/II-fold pyridoxal phosphate-dependent enzyme [Anaerolineae bacterium]
MTKTATRLENLQPYFFAVIAQQLHQMRNSGIDVIALDIGSPDLPPPPGVVETLCKSASKPDTHGYTGYRGTPEFRKAVARYYKRRFDVELNPDTEILPLLGSKEGIVNLSLAYLDRGDTSLIPDISYPSYSQGARLAGGDIQWLSVNEEDGYLPQLKDLQLDKSRNPRILWLNYPNNPTGAVASNAFYADAVAFCNDHDLVLASDNPYVDVTYDGFEAGSVLEIDDAKQCSIEFMSFSKTYNMGGWRLGAAVGNAEILKRLLQVKSNIDSGHFQSVYDAGVVALDETTSDWIRERNNVYQRRRDLIMEVLQSIGLRASLPLGSLYIWAQTLDMDGSRYVQMALEGAHVAFAPGAAYGPGGEQFIRISLGIADNRLIEALDRLKHWYQSQ